MEPVIASRITWGVSANAHEPEHYRCGYNRRPAPGAAVGFLASAARRARATPAGVDRIKQGFGNATEAVETRPACET